MNFRIFVIEDTPERNEWFTETFPDSVIADTKVKAFDKIEDNHDFIFLDNDFEEEGDVGYEIAKYMIKNNLHRRTQIIIHSMNPVMASRIFNMLIKAEYTNVYKRPFSILVKYGVK